MATERQDIHWHDLRHLKSVSCAAFRDPILLKAMKIMVRNLLRGEKLLNKLSLNKLRSIVGILLRGERKKFHAT